MKIRFLGTAASEGIPALYCPCETCKRARLLGESEHRTRSQTLINDRLMIDFPPETYAHALKAGLALKDIHSYLITHTHSDHFYPNDIAMIGGVFSNQPKDAEKYHFYGGEEMVKAATPYAEKTEGLAQLHALKPFKTYQIDGFSVTPLKANHGTATPYIYIISDGQKTILYAHDTGLFLKETEDYLYTEKPFFDLVSFDCTCGTWPDKNYGSHLSFGNIKTLAERMKREGLISDKSILCVNHFSHNASDVLYENREIYEKEGFIMSRDGLEVEF